jgi:hypothetical protein
MVMVRDGFGCEMGLSGGGWSGSREEEGSVTASRCAGMEYSAINNIRRNSFT